MNKRTILVDMDSILADFLQGILDLHNAETGDTAVKADVKTWDHQFAGGQDCYTYFKRPGFFRGLAPIDGAKDALKLLHERANTLIVSSATITDVPTEKFKWLDKHMGFFPRKNVIFAAKKGFVRGDVLIDDYPVNAEEWLPMNPGGKVITLAYGYNIDYPHYGLRATNWPDLIAWLETNDYI